MPKTNMYRSLHTTLFSDTGLPFEVQIRTYEMHRTSEYGIAAHWMYKEGRANQDELDSKLAWLREALELENYADTTKEFVESIRKDFFSDYVYVLTPRGQIIDLVTGSTPLDFAYRIHSNVGNHVQHAKVNGAIVRLDYKLKNNDFCEIVTAPNATPSRDWLKIAKSGSARAKIKQWLKKEKREENIVNGRAAFESELKHYGISVAAVTGDELRPTLLKKTGFGNLDDMYAAIGYGGFSAQKAVNRIRDELKALNKQQQAERDATVPIPGEPGPAVPMREKSEDGIVVQGLSNCLVKFSKCCTPVPGDDIVGFITRGYGVSVHRADCPNAAPERRRPEEAGRWVKVSWGKDVKQSYQTSLDIYAKDRIDLVLDVSAVLSSTQTRVAGLNAKTTADGFALIHLEIFVADSEQLSAVMRRLHQISGVMKVDRPAG